MSVSGALDKPGRVARSVLQSRCMLHEALSSSALIKIALTVGALLLVAAVRYAVVGIAQLSSGAQRGPRTLFWTRQISNLLSLALCAIALLEIWVEPGDGKALPLGLVSAGVAVALQKVWTAFAGYLVLLRGGVYRVGDRVSIGGIRGDVIALGFLYTRIMEMGEPELPDQRSIWVGARQFTGRIVTVTNDKIFDSPVFNYTRDFPFLFEEMLIPIKYDADRERAEKILLSAADAVTAELRQLSQQAEKRLLDEYQLKLEELAPRVYYRLTDNWIELTLRFVVGEHGIRAVKDQISRAVLRDFEAAGLSLASGTYEVVGLPRIQVDLRHEPQNTGPRSAGTVRGKLDQPPSAGTARGKLDQSPSTDTARGKLDPPPSAGTARGKLDQPPSAGTARGKLDQPPSAGTARGKLDDPRSAGTARSNLDEPRSAGSARGNLDELPSASSARGNLDDPNARS